MTTIHGLAACAVLESSQLGSLAHSFIKKSSKTPDDRLVSSLTRKICVVKSGMGKQPSRGDLCPRVPDDHTRSGSVGSVRLCSCVGRLPFRLLSRLQLAFELVQEAPVGAIGNNLLRARLDQPGIAHPQ